MKMVHVDKNSITIIQKNMTRWETVLTPRGK